MFDTGVGAIQVLVDISRSVVNCDIGNPPSLKGRDI
jgi:hypothetical protein